MLCARSFLQSNIILQAKMYIWLFVCVQWRRFPFLSYFLWFFHFSFWISVKLFFFSHQIVAQSEIDFFFANRDFQDGRRPRWVPLGLLSVIHVPFYHKFWKTKTPILPALLLLKLLSDSLRSLLTRPKSSIFMGRSWSFANTVKKKTFFKSPTVRLWK